MIISFKNFSKWPSPKILYDFILISNWITNSNFGITLLVSKISLWTDPPCTYIMYFIISHFLALKRSKFRTTGRLSFWHWGLFHLCRIMFLRCDVVLKQIEFLYLSACSSTYTFLICQSYYIFISMTLRYRKLFRIHFAIRELVSVWKEIILMKKVLVVFICRIIIFFFCF